MAPSTPSAPSPGRPHRPPSRDGRSPWCTALISSCCARPAWLEMQGIDHRELTRALTSAARATLVTQHAIEPCWPLPASECSPSWSTPIHARPSSTCPRTRTCSWWARAAEARLRTALLGSVSASVARRAHCPVVVCRPPEHEPSASNRVVVGADGTRCLPAGPGVRVRAGIAAWAPAHRHALLLGRDLGNPGPGCRPGRRGRRPGRPAAADGRVRRPAWPRSTRT